MDIAENVVSIPWSVIRKDNLVEKFKKMTENKNQLFVSQFKVCLKDLIFNQIFIIYYKLFY